MKPVTKSIKELESLNDKRLLSYYNSIRAKTNAFVNESLNYDGIESAESPIERAKAVVEAKNYLETVKNVLNKRGHINR